MLKCICEMAKIVRLNTEVEMSLVLAILLTQETQILRLSFFLQVEFSCIVPYSADSNIVMCGLV